MSNEGRPIKICPVGRFILREDSDVSQPLLLLVSCAETRHNLAHACKDPLTWTLERKFPIQNEINDDSVNVKNSIHSQIPSSCGIGACLPSMQPLVFEFLKDVRYSFVKPSAAESTHYYSKIYGGAANNHGEQTPFHRITKCWDDVIIKMDNTEVRSMNATVGGSVCSNPLLPRDYEFSDDGSTVLELATSRQNFQVSEVMLPSHSNIQIQVDANAVKFCDTTTPVLFSINSEMDSINLREAEAESFYYRDIANRYIYNWSNMRLYPRRERFNPSHLSEVKATMNPIRDRILLLVATMLATFTFQAALNFSSSHAIMSSGWFMALNSTAFVASVVMIIFLLHAFPYRPWPQVAASALFGSYFYLMKAMSPQLALPLLYISLPFLFLAAAGKLVVEVLATKEERSAPVI